MKAGSVSLRFPSQKSALSKKQHSICPMHQLSDFNPHFLLLCRWPDTPAQVAYTQLCIFEIIVESLFSQPTYKSWYHLHRLFEVPFLLIVHSVFQTRDMAINSKGKSNHHPNASDHSENISFSLDSTIQGGALKSHSGMR